jgi:pimeloyl-ACP methyl ester carboxylesterase
MTATMDGRTGQLLGEHRLWYEQRGHGPDVLLIAGLGDSVEAWDLQLRGLADGHRLLGFDNPGAGRSPLPPGALTVAGMADAAAELLRALDIRRTHVMGFSGGSAIAQELALRHAEVVRSLVLVSTWSRLDTYARSMVDAWRWLAAAAPSPREMLEAFFLWIYSPRAHADGTVAQIIEEALAFPFPQSPENFQRQLEAFAAHDTHDRLPQIAVPTLVLAGGIDVATPPRLGRAVANRIPGAQFEVLREEAHQPFQERPDEFNARVSAFWTSVEGERS